MRFALLCTDPMKNYPMRKRFEGAWGDDGDPLFQGYSRSKFFRCIMYDLSGLDEFYQFLLFHQDKKRSNVVMIRGEVMTGPKFVRRSNEYKLRRLVISRDEQYGEACFTDVARDWIMIDIDSGALPPGTREEEVYTHVVERLPFLKNVDAVVQHSSKSGFQKLEDGSLGFKETKLHVFVLLDREYTNDELKRWAANVSVETGQEIDQSLYNAVQAHYILAPDFNGVSDPISKRIFRVEGEIKRLSITIPAEPVLNMTERFERVERKGRIDKNLWRETLSTMTPSGCYPVYREALFQFLRSFGPNEPSVGEREEFFEEVRTTMIGVGRAKDANGSRWKERLSDLESKCRWYEACCRHHGWNVPDDVKLWDKTTQHVKTKEDANGLVWDEDKQQLQALTALDECLADIRRDVAMGIPRGYFLAGGEGIGKSRLALKLATLMPHNSVIVFACKTWVACEEKLIEFERAFAEIAAQGGVRRKAAIAFSSERKMFNRWRVKPSYKSERAFDIPSVDEKRTIRTLARVSGLTLKDATSEYKRFKTDKISEIVADRDVKIVLTTIARLATPHGDVLPECVIWIDDPSEQEFDEYRAIPGAYPTMTREDVREKFCRDSDMCKKVNDRWNYVRPDLRKLAVLHRMRNIVLTTTESLVGQSIERQFQRHNVRLKKYGDREIALGGTLTILGTNMTRANLDGSLAFIATRLSQTHGDVVLIGDGVGARYNLTNVKGVNVLMGLRTIIKISVLAPSVVEERCIQHDVPYDNLKERESLVERMVLDRLHQALGRNLGARFRDGAECVVLVDPKYFNMLTSKCQYEFDRENSMLIDHSATPSSDRKRTEVIKGKTGFVGDVMALLRNPASTLENKDLFEATCMQYRESCRGDHDLWYGFEKRVVKACETVLGSVPDYVTSLLGDYRVTNQ